MRRMFLSLAATIAVTLVAAMASFAAMPISPKPGPYEGPTSQTAASSGYYKAGFKVLGSGKRKRVAMNVGMETHSNVREGCKAGSFSFRTANLVPDHKSGSFFPSPLPIKNGGFSATRTYHEKGADGKAMVLTVEISARFRSRTKLAGTLSIEGKPLPRPKGKLDWEEEALEELYEGQGLCAKGKVSFTAKRLSGRVKP